MKVVMSLVIGALCYMVAYLLINLFVMQMSSTQFFLVSVFIVIAFAASRGFDRYVLEIDRD